MKGWILASWYNWGVLRLKAGELNDAEERFQEVLDLEPNDHEARSHLEVVHRYQTRPPDASLTAYSQGLPLRKLD